MRIALLAPLVTPIAEPQRGGSQSLVADLARGLTERGGDVDVYAATGSRIEGASVVDTGVRSEELAEALVRPGRPAPGRSAVTRDAFARVWGMIREHRYDIVHNHAFDAPAVEFGTDIGCPVVHTLHLPPDEDVARALDACRRLEAPPVVVAVSRPQGLAWARRVRVDAVVPNGVPVARIPYGSGGERAVCAGRLSPEKGVVDAIRIARTAGVGIDVVGDAYDPDYARDHVRPLVDGDEVRLTPGVPRTELWDRLGTALAVLCPVAWEEPFGLVAAEAQAAGTPVVAYRRGGLAAVVADGRTGRLVEPGDVEAAARALAAAGTIEREACRVHARATLDLESMLDAHTELYDGVLFEAETRAAPRPETP